MTTNYSFGCSEVLITSKIRSKNNWWGMGRRRIRVDTIDQLEDSTSICIYRPRWKLNCMKRMESGLYLICNCSKVTILWAAKYKESDRLHGHSNIKK